MAFVAFRRFSQRQRLEGKLRPGQELRPSPEVGWSAAPGLSSKARNTTPTRTLGDPVIRAAQGKAASARPPFSSSINGMTTIRTLTQRRRLECCFHSCPLGREGFQFVVPAQIKPDACRLRAQLNVTREEVGRSVITKRAEEHGDNE